MLGRLARWLRVLGFDTLYDATANDPDIVRQSSVERRVLLTRDRHLLRELRPPRALEIESDVPLIQLRQVVGALGLPAPAELFTRCLLCNTLLEDVPPERYDELLPPAARVNPGRVRECPTCGRVYWEGSHARRMRDALERALPGWFT